MTELVSILIPAYKAERFIAETVANVRAQTWPRKEIIIVDDGSPDSTYEAAKRLEGPDLKVVRQDNAGAPTARNTAYALAQGEYIQWLDADDLLHPDKIRLQLQGAESGLTSKTVLTCAWGQFFFDPRRAEFSPDSLWRSMSPVEWILTRFRDNVWMNPAVWLISRKTAELAGSWDARLARSGDDDGEYICRAVGVSDYVRFVPEAKCYYRIGTVGSLNWNMATREDVLDSLALSMKLSVQHLIKLEDSERTRDAGARHLQTFLMAYFYGADERYFRDLNEFARELLNRGLQPPTVSWKYRPVELLCGRKFTRKFMANWRAAKVLLRRRYHAFLYERSRSSAAEAGYLQNSY